jgi:tetratricopeptide (TPR) repeat protein
LRQSGAHALLWGAVVNAKNRVPRLYWTAEAGSTPPRDTSTNYLPTEDASLPEISWDDLKQLLNLTVATAAEEFAALDGHYHADPLMPFISQVRELLERGMQRQWDATTLSPIWFVFGNALSSLGEQTGDNQRGMAAIAAYQQTLDGYTRERVPLQWAATQNNLGNALRTLGERESGTARLEEALTAYRDALLEYTREHVPLQWAMTQSNLGSAPQTLGERESGTARLEEAVTAYREALLEYTREHVPQAGDRPGLRFHPRRLIRPLCRHDRRRPDAAHRRNVRTVLSLRVWVPVEFTAAPSKWAYAGASDRSCANFYWGKG